MARIDPEHERKRLVDFYSQQMDGELEAVARQAYELTEIAREALRAELANRGITTQLVEQAPVIAKTEPMPATGDPPPPEPPGEETESEDGEFEQRKLVTLRKFRDLPEALLAQGLLASADIDTVLADDNVVRMDWFWSNLMGGVKLRVSAEDAEAANEILNQPIPKGFDATGTGDYQQPHCPYCQSLDVTFQELNKPIAYATAYFGLPIPLKRRAWRCHSCNAEWEDDGVEDGSESRS